MKFGSCVPGVEPPVDGGFGALARRYLKRRLPDEETLGRKVQALVRERNAARSSINWRFRIQDARTKLHHLYPFDSKLD